MVQTKSPAGFSPIQTIAFGAIDGEAQTVTAATALPVTTAASGASGVAALTGTASASTTVGPFTPALNRSINLTLSGTWNGSVQLLRSVDGGTTRLPLTLAGSSYGSYNQNTNEPVWSESESGAAYYLAITVSSGTVSFRLAH